MATPYIEIFNRDGVCVERMAQGCARYSTATELDMLERGYTIKINGRKVTKKELRENANTTQS
jgi:hypothetical protein